MLTGVITNSEDVPDDFRLTSLRAMSLPRSVLMCPPAYFDVVEIKNPFMEGQLNKVRHNEAVKQWEELKSAFEKTGIEVHVIDPLKGCEDMVFCANPIFCGLDGKGRRKCVLSKMKHESRKREGASFVNWLGAHGYEVIDLRQQPHTFEGGGDAIWHPGRAMIWGGYGERTDPEIYGLLSAVFNVPVCILQRVDSRFYHLDTCFCPIDGETVLLYAPAFTETGLSLIKRLFARIIEVDEIETVENFACNATALLGKYVFIQKGASKTAQQLRELGYEVIEVETGEFLKSGGSVFCMKSAIF
jgi:N-dimethylarginine dimethylaminohydrolase